MRIPATIALVLLAFAGQSQYRVALDFSSALDNAFLSLLYCPVFKQHYYVKTGISSGNYGNGEVYEGKEYEGKFMTGPYAEMNQHPENPNLSLVQYVSKNKGYGLEIGVGRFWELGPVHTIRCDLQLKGYHIRETITAAFMEHPNDTLAYFYHYAFNRNCVSIGPEVFHAIRFSARWTFYYGLKLPFFLPLRTRNYQPQNWKDLTLGFQPHLAIGISYAVQKKQLKKVRTE